MTRHTENSPDSEEEYHREQPPELPPGLPKDAVRAYDALVRNARPRAVGFCMKSGLSRAQAEDLVQTAFKVVWIKWPVMNAWEPGRQWGYFQGVVRRMLPGFYKREERQRMLPEKALRSNPDLDVVGGEIVTTTAADIPHQAVEDQATMDELNHLLTHPDLKPNYRDSLRLVDDGLSAKERAEINGISEGAERVQTHRARVRAQTIKSSEEEDDQ